MRLVKLASRGTAIFALELIAVLSGRAQTAPPKLVPFNDFIKDVSRVASSNYVARPASAVKTATSFEEMRRHTLSMYDGVSVRHSWAPTLLTAFQSCSS
jgi:hypothetical protein